MAKETLEMHLNGKPAIATIKALTSTVAALRQENEKLNGQYAVLKEEMNRLEAAGLKMSDAQRQQMDGIQKQLNANKRTIRDLEDVIAGAVTDIQQLDKVLSGTVEVSTLNMKKLKELQKEMGKRMDNMGSQNTDEAKAQAQQLQTAFRIVSAEIDSRMAELKRNFMDMGQVADDYIAKEKEIGLAQMAANSQMVQAAHTEFVKAQNELQLARADKEKKLELLEEEKKRNEELKAIQADEKGKAPVTDDDITRMQAAIEDTKNRIAENERLQREAHEKYNRQLQESGTAISKYINTVKQAEQFRIDSGDKNRRIPIKSYDNVEKAIAERAELQKKANVLDVINQKYALIEQSMKYASEEEKKELEAKKKELDSYMETLAGSKIKDDIDKYVNSIRDGLREAEKTIAKFEQTWQNRDRSNFSDKDSKAYQDMRVEIAKSSKEIKDRREELSNMMQSILQDINKLQNKSLVGKPREELIKTIEERIKEYEDAKQGYLEMITYASKPEHTVDDAYYQTKGDNFAKTLHEQEKGLRNLELRKNINEEVAQSEADRKKAQDEADAATTREEAAVKGLTEANKKADEMMQKYGLSSAMTTKELRDMISALKEQQDNVTLTSEEYAKNAQRMADLQKILHSTEMNAKKDVAENVLRDPQYFSDQEIKESVKSMNEYIDTMEMTKEQRRSLIWLITKGEAELAKSQNGDNMARMDGQFNVAIHDAKEFASLSDNALQAQQKFWLQQSALVEKGSEEQKMYLARFHMITEEVERRQQMVDEVGAERLRAEGKAGNWKETSDSRLGEIRKQYAADLSKIDPTTDPARYKEYKSILMEVIREEERRKNLLKEIEDEVKGVAGAMTKDQMMKVLAEPLKHSSEEVQKAMKMAEEEAKRLFNPELGHDMQSGAYRALSESINKAKDDMEKFNADAKKITMLEQMKKIGDISREAMKQQENYWKGIRDNANSTAGQITEAKRELILLNQEMVIRGERASNNYTFGADGKVDTGGRSIEQVKKDIELMEKYREALRAGSPAAEELSNKITALRDVIRSNSEEAKKSSSDGLYTQKETMDMLNKNNFDEKGRYKGTLSELEKLKKSAEKWRKEMDLSTKEGKQGFAELESGMDRVVRAEKSAGAAVLEIGDDFKKSVKSMSLGELEKAAERLKVQLRNLKPGKEFNDMAKASREVNTQLEIQKQKLGESRSLWDSLTNGLVRHISMMMSFRALWRKTNELIKRDETLSDLMTNVEKVSGLTAEEVHNLTSALEGLDTRTNIDQLLELSEQAGKLGVATRNGAQGVMQFAVAGQKITSTLGEIGGAEAISDLLKVNDLINKGSGLGLEESLYKIGSGVLQIGNNSKASYKDVVEFTQRLGSIGAVSKMTMQQVMALGGTFSALGGNVESSSTAMGRILLGLTTRTKEIAKATNLSTTALQELVNEGKTFEALEMVLESIKDKGSQGVVDLLSAIGGKNNTQAKAALSTLVTNMDELNYQLMLAEEGYEDGTLVTKEFDKANDNLAGTMQRVRNEWDEITTNPSTTGFINTLAHGLLAIVKTMKNFPVLLGLVATAMFALMTATSKTIISISALQVAWDRLKMSFASINPFTWFLTFIPTIIGLIATFTKKSDNLSTALQDSSNEADEQVEKMGHLVTKLEDAGIAAKKLQGNLDEMNKKLEDGTEKTKEHEDAERDLIKAKGEHSRLITEFNNKYGQYIDFIIKDTDSSELLAAAKRKVAAAIREEALARLETQIQEDAWNEHGENIESKERSVGHGSRAVATEINGRLRDDKIEGLNLDISEAVTTYVRNTIEAAFKKGVDTKEAAKKMSVKGDVEKIVKQFITALPVTSQDAILKSDAMGILVSNARKAADAWGEYYKQRKEGEDVINEKQERARKELEDATHEEMKQASEQSKLYKEQYDDADDPDERIRLLGNAIEKQDQYLNLIERRKREGKEITEQEQRQYSLYSNIIGSMRKSLSEQLAKRFWGADGEDLKSKKVETLVERYKELNDAVAKLGEGMSYAEALGEGFANMLNGMNPEDATKAARNEAERIKNELDRRGLNTEGKFKWTKDSDKNKWKTDTKEEMDGLLAALDDYYVRRQMVIEKRRLDEMMTEEEFNRMTEALEREHQDRRGELQQEFLGNESKGLRQWIKENTDALDIEGNHIAEALGKIIGKTNFSKLYKNLAKLDKEQKGKLFSGIQLSIDQGSLKVQKSLHKMNEDFRKALLETDPMDVLMDNYREKLEKVGLLFADGMEHNEKELYVRMQLLEQLSMDIRNIGVEMMEGMFESLSMDDLVGLSTDQYAVMHNMLTQMADDYDETLRKMVNARKKNADALWEGDGSKKLWDAAEEAMSKRQGTIERMNELSGAGDDYAKRAGRDVFYVKAEAAQAYLEVLEKVNEAEQERIKNEIEQARANEKAAESDEDRMFYASVIADKENMLNKMRIANEYMLADAKKAVNDSIQEYTDAEIERINSLVAQLQPYSDALSDFSESFGEAVFGSKEDRQEAARDLLRSVVKTTGELTKQWLIQWATKAAIDKMMIAEDQARATASMAISGQEAGVELGTEAAKTSGVIAASGAQATAKEVAKRGLIGLAIGAAISAALGALMGLALGRINKAKNEIPKSNNGRMSATMLTYAEGTDPVMGSDGKVYDAKRVKSWKTGLVKGPHYGIVGEKGTELIVDATRTREVVKRPWLMNMVRNPQALPLQMDNELIARSIRILEQSGSMPMRGMRLYATGNVDEITGRMNTPSEESEGTVAGMSQETAQELAETIRGLKETLAQGIKASINMYGDDGLHQSMKKAERYYNR